MKFSRTHVMGILNVTPDSFSDGGKFNDVERAVTQALKMVHEGADSIDIGGESSGPGSVDVSVEDELARVIPVVKALRARSEIVISIDTAKAEVARQAIEAGANMVNDVTAFRGDPAMIEVVREAKVPVVMMYSKDATTRTSLDAREYEDVVREVKEFLQERINFAVMNGVGHEFLIVDPGMGAFVSSHAKYSLELLRRLEEFEELGVPMLVGPSRKSFIGNTLNLPLGERLEGTLACVAVAVVKGARMVRVHDVQAARRVVDMCEAIRGS